MELPQTLEVKGMRVLTTKQLSEMYGVDPKIIQYNFRHNKDKYSSNKHYIEVTGEELRQLKTRSEFQSSLKYAKSLYLWTEKGALLHAKFLNTDKAWQVYDYLVDFYFRVKENNEPKEIQWYQKDKNMAIKNPIPVFKTLIELAEKNHLKIKSCELKSYKSYIRNDRVAIRTDLSLEEIDYELAYILAHAYIHEKEGDLINNVYSQQYDDRAKRATNMIIEMLDIACA